MKKVKLFLVVGIVVSLFSCKTNTKTADGLNDESKEVATEDDRDLIISSYQLLKNHNDDPDGYIASIKGKEVTITDVLVQSGYISEMAGEYFMWGEAPGFSKSYSSQTNSGYLGYSDPDNGVKIMVDGEEMQEFKEFVYTLNLVKVKGKESTKIVNYVAQDGVSTFHTMLTMKIDGAAIEPAGISLKLSGGEITGVKNF